MRLITHQAWLCATLFTLAIPTATFAHSIQLDLSADTYYSVRGHGRSDQTIPSRRGDLDLSDFVRSQTSGRLSFQKGDSCGLPGIDSTDVTLSSIRGDDTSRLTQRHIDFGRIAFKRFIRDEPKDSKGDLQDWPSKGNAFMFGPDADRHHTKLARWLWDERKGFDGREFNAEHCNSHNKFCIGLQPADITPNPQVVPVPAAIWLLGSGLIALIGAARRR